MLSARLSLAAACAALLPLAAAWNLTFWGVGGASGHCPNSDSGETYNKWEYSFHSKLGSGCQLVEADGNNCYFESYADDVGLQSGSCSGPGPEDLQTFALSANAHCQFFSDFACAEGQQTHQTGSKAIKCGRPTKNVVTFMCNDK